MVEKAKIWIMSFEYAGIAKVGGLGEVPANQARNLMDQFEITVFIPSHGQIERLKTIYKVEKLPINCVGQLNTSILGINELPSNYNITFYKLNIDKVRIILLSGENAFTSKFLNDKIVYNPDTISGKLCLFSIGMRYYIKNLIKFQSNEMPEIIHMHDYHVVIPFIGIKQELYGSDDDIPSIITIHLLTWPRYNIDFYRACGIDDTPIEILQKNGSKSLTIEEIFALCGDSDKSSPPTVEKVGAVVSDLVTSVSKSYLETDIIPNLGKDLIKFKSDFIWDGCDWDYDEIFHKVINMHDKEICEVLGIPNKSDITIKKMKNYLLTHKIGHLSQDPLINSENVLKSINEISDGNLFIKNGNVNAFSESGPLIIATGRISPQKGFETIFKAIPEVINIIPNAKFLLLILPTDYSLNEIKSYANFVKQYPKNLRIIFGVVPDIFFLAHIVADVYAILSRWEPFGIIALEAMAMKLPVIATRVGGLQESVIDVREDSENGTGILIEKDNPKEMVQALISIFKLAEISEKVKNGMSIHDLEIMLLVNEIPDPILQSRVLLDANYYNKIKQNCYRRVNNNFKWDIVSKKLVDLYSKVLNLNSIS